MKKIIALALNLAFIALMLMPTPEIATAAHDKTHITVTIDDAGFNGKPGDFTIEVDQGQLVELTFVWAHKGYPNEEHVMVLEGYKLEWGQIDSQNRQATLKFIADKPGTFTFKCDLKCDLHDYLQSGRLKVKSGGASGATTAARTATKLTLEPSSWTTKGQSVSLMAVLKDDKGAAVAKAPVQFFVDAEFIGTKGKMEIGVTKTDANGVAFLDYRPTLDLPKHAITAQFEGMGIFADSAMSIELKESGPPSSTAYHLESMGLDDIRGAAPFVLVGVVLAVWGTYTFVLSQVFGIFRLRERR